MSYRIDIKDLPAKYQMQALRQIQEQQKKQQGRNTLAAPTSATSNHSGKQPESNSGKKTARKYRSQDVVSENGIQFRSKKELKRYKELMELLAAGVISDLKLEPQFTLIEGYKKPNGERVKRMRYTADFSYIRDGKLVVEDVKSRPTKTTSYQIRKNMMKDKYGINIVEV